MNDRLTLVIEFVEKLHKAKIYCSVRCTSYDAISIDVAVPGQRWEIDFLKDGSVDIEIFKSNGNIYDRAKLSELFEKFSD